MLCDRLAIERRLSPPRSEFALTLGDYLTRYLTNRTDLKLGTIRLHDMMCRYLQTYFGSEIRIDRIDRTRAANWRAALAQDNLEASGKCDQFNGKPTTQATVCLHVRNTKVTFNHAVEEDLIPFNPFDRPRGKASELAKG